MMNGAPHRIFKGLLLLLLLAGGQAASCQSRKADSLLKLLATNPADSIRYKALMDYSVEIRFSDPLHSLEAVREGLALAQKENNPRRLAAAYSKLGLLYGDMGHLDQSLENHLQSLKIYEGLQDTLQIAGAQLNVGIVYHKMDDLESALKWLNKSLAGFRQMKNRYGEAYVYNNMAMINRKKHNFSEAYELYSKSLMIKEELKDSASLGNGYLNMGLSCEDRGYRDKAIEYYRHALEIYKATNNVKGFAGVYNNLGELLIDQGIEAEGKAMLMRSLEYSQQVHSKEDELQAHLNLSHCFEKEGNYDEALKHYNLYRSCKDTILNESAARQIALLQAVYETEKKDGELKKAEQDARISAEKLSRMRIIIIAIVVGLLFSVLLLVLLVNRYRFRITTNRMLAGTNIRINTRRKEITDSIAYARRIQESILPRLERFTDLIPESFLLHQPREIVSGDFYWLYREGKTVYAAVADNLLHGVPGAFVSMTGVNILNAGVEDEGIRDLQRLLEYVEKGIHDMLGGDGESGRRLNLSVCRIDMENGKLDYASTDNPLYLVNSKGVNEVISRNGQVMNLQLKKGDTIYMFTDGFEDQLGGGEGKKMLTKKVSEILFRNWPIPMHRQKQGLLSEFESWRGSFEQVDDVLVMGIRY
jgi:tetratricopeptide (TPR) repeat protein